MEEKLFLIALIVVTSIMAWITAIRIRRRIKRAIGIKATEVELTSISTWIRVRETEEQKMR